LVASVNRPYKKPPSFSEPFASTKQLVLNPSERDLQKQINESYHGEYEPLLCLAAASHYFASLR
jgi:hypothetical protein